VQQESHTPKIRQTEKSGNWNQLWRSTTKIYMLQIKEEGVRFKLTINGKMPELKSVSSQKENGLNFSAQPTIQELQQTRSTENMVN